MLLTLTHELNLLDAADGYICEPLMMELEKLKEQDITIEIDVDYSPGCEAVMHLKNGDPGHAAESEEIEPEKEADDYAWGIIKDLCVSINGLPIEAVLRNAEDVQYNLRLALRVNIQNFFDNDLSEAVAAKFDEDDGV